MVLTKRQKQALATKQKILDTAEELIGKRGFDNVTVDDIVEACGVAKGTFYLYFKTKAELVVYIERTPYDRLMKDLDSIKDRPFEERIHHLLMGWFELMNKYNIHFARQSLRHDVDPAFAGLESESLTQMDIGMELVKKFLEDAVSRGDLIQDTPVTTVTRLISFSMQGCATYHFKCEGSFPVMDWAVTYIDFVKNTILKPYMG